MLNSRDKSRDETRSVLRVELDHGLYRFVGSHAIDSSAIHYVLMMREFHSILLERLKEACQKGDIKAFYASIREDPYLLENIDKIPFVDTPLHIAVEAGQTEFALEIIRLKPSFTRKPNQDGFSPMHLALQKEKTQMVLWFVEDDPDLVCVKGREGITPLHYVAEKGDVELLKKFLSVCPKSVEDLTIQRETALHIALKNEKFDAFKVLVGWLQPLWYDWDTSLKHAVLNSKDKNGNTVLHIAASINKPELVADRTRIIQLLVKNKALDVNAKNSEGWTAMDISQRCGHLEVEDMLRRAGAGAPPPVVVTVADYLMRKMSFYERWIISILRGRRYMSSKSRNALLVVVVLIATTTYQAGLTPPGGPPDGPPVDFPYYTHLYRPFGSIIMDATLNTFTIFNTIAFYMSLAIIFVLLPTDGVFVVLLSPPLCILGLCHYLSVLVTALQLGMDFRALLLFLFILIVEIVGGVLVAKTVKKHKLLLLHQTPKLL